MSIFSFESLNPYFKHENKFIMSNQAGEGAFEYLDMHKNMGADRRSASMMFLLNLNMFYRVLIRYASYFLAVLISTYIFKKV